MDRFFKSAFLEVAAVEGPARDLRLALAQSVVWMVPFWKESKIRARSSSETAFRLVSVQAAKARLAKSLSDWGHSVEDIIANVRLETRGELEHREDNAQIQVQISD